MFSWLFPLFGGQDDRKHSTPFLDRPTPSAAPLNTFTPSTRTPRARTRTPAAAPTPSATPSSTWRAVSPSPVVRTRRHLEQIGRDGTPRVKDAAYSILPRMSGVGKTPDFDD